MYKHPGKWGDARPRAPGAAKVEAQEGSLKVVEAQEGSLKCEANRFEHQGCRLRRCVF